MKKVLNITVLVLSMGGLVAVLGFSAHEVDALKCSNLAISVDHKDGHFFISDTDVRSLMLSRGDSLIGKQLSNIDIDGYERMIERHPSVRRAEVFTRLDGTLGVRVTQRRPVMRVFTLFGESFYIDSEGGIMPTSANYTARVPVASGHITDRFDWAVQYDLNHLSDTLAQVSVLDDLYRLTQFLNNEPLWAAQIEQVQVTPEGEFMLVPRVGQHHILFGPMTNIEGKFNKLNVFYEEGLARTGWDIYETINLKFKDQVICTRKQNTHGQ